MKHHGSPKYCPACRSTLPPPASSYGQTQCPRCEAQLWHFVLPSGPAFFIGRAGESIYDFMAGLGDHPLSAKDLEAILKGADPLDVIEILAELEGALRS